MADKIDFVTELHQRMYRELAKHDALTIIAREKFVQDRRYNRDSILCINTPYDDESARLVELFDEEAEQKRSEISLKYAIELNEWCDGNPRWWLNGGGCMGDE